MKRLRFFLFLVVTAANAQHVPTFEEVISLRDVNGISISNDGRNVAITIQTTDWNENRYDTEVWLSKDGKMPFPLTNNPRNGSNAASFSPDGQWIAFLSDRGNKNQIHVIRTDGGEARAVTKEEEGVTSYEWHPSGRSFIFVKPEKEDKNKKEREKRYGGFETDDRDFTLSHIWQVEFKPELPDPSERPCYESTDSLKMKAGCLELPKATRLTEGKFTVNNFLVSPDGTKVAFTQRCASAREQGW